MIFFFDFFFYVFLFYLFFFSAPPHELPTQAHVALRFVIGGPRALDPPPLVPHVLHRFDEIAGIRAHIPPDHRGRKPG